MKYLIIMLMIIMQVNLSACGEPPQPKDENVKAIKKYTIYIVESFYRNDNNDFEYYSMLLSSRSSLPKEEIKVIVLDGIGYCQNGQFKEQIIESIYEDIIKRSDNNEIH